MRKIWKRTMAVVMCAGMIFTGQTAIFAQNFTANQEEETPTVNYNDKENQLQNITKEELQQFLDSYFEKNMQKFHVPGAAVAVVSGQEELFCAGYGNSSLEKKEPVDAKTTLFPACSVSKLFTATAVMQLAEKDEIDLNQDVTPYLDGVKIENAYEVPVTTANLLTHSSGLDEQSELLGSTTNRAKIKSQQDYFHTHEPKVIHEPGTTSCYSNMGYNLLGYEVENVSGLSYEKYVKTYILDPLDMKNASVRQTNGDMAEGYAYDNDTYEAQPFAYQYTSGSSGVICSVTDMEHFMIMNLNEGSYKGSQILSPKSEEEMQKQQFANEKVFEGMGYGFIRDKVKGVEILKHEGALPGYATTMLLFPEQDLGIYVATNSLSGICFDFEEAFLNQFAFRDLNSEIGTVNETEEGIEKQDFSENINDVQKFIGTYRSYDGIARKNLMKIGILMDETDLVVSEQKDGTLKMCVYDQNKEKVETRLIPYGKDTFLRQDGKGYLAFRLEEKSGRPVYAYTNVSHATFEKIHWWENKKILGFAVAGSGLILLFGNIFIRLMRHKKEEEKNLWFITSRFVSVLSCVGTLSAMALTVTMILNYNYSKIGGLKILLAGSSACDVGMIMLSFFALFSSIRKKHSKKQTISICTFLIFQIIWFLVVNYFQLFGVHIV